MMYTFRKVINILLYSGKEDNLPCVQEKVISFFERGIIHKFKFQHR